MERYHYYRNDLRQVRRKDFRERGRGGGGGGGGGVSGEKEYGTPSWGYRDLGFCNPSTSEAIEDMNSPSIAFLLSSSFLLRMGDGL